MSLEKVRVKEEVEWENEAEESETAERAGMYAELEIEIDPESIQQTYVTSTNRDGTNSDIKSAWEVSLVKTEPIEIKVEPEIVDDLQLNDQTDGTNSDIKSALELSLVKTELIEIKIEPDSVDDLQLNDHRDPLNVGCSNDALAKCSVKLEGILTEMFNDCKICGRTFDTISSFQTHMDSHEAIGVKTECYECDMCDKSFKKRSDLIEHIKCKQKSHSCATCRRHSSCESKYLAQEQYHNFKHTFSCKICERIFRADRKLFRCERSCGNYIYHCKICKQEFSKHYSTVICDICKKVVTSKYTLKTHLKTHTGEKPYCCKICNKRFAAPSAFINHGRIHVREKPYSCDVCDKRFTSKDSLNNHEIIHTRQKRFSCKICHKQFNKADALRAHERAVKARQPYVCVICNKRFCYKRSVKAHQMSHIYSSEPCELSDSDVEKPRADIPENIEEIKKKMAGDGESEPQKTVINTYKRSTAAAMFSCDVCKKQFTKQSSLTQHVQILHPIEKSFMSTQ